MLAVSLGLGYWLPQLVLEEISIPRYQEALRYALPDALDMMVVCVEAGIGLDQAIRMVSEELDDHASGTLCSENSG
jgi:tight adherence protein C